MNSQDLYNLQEAYMDVYQKRRGQSGGGLRESYDLYDIILSHLLDEGYAETPEAAEAIMVSMSEEWRDSIVEEVLDESRGGAASPGTPESYHELSRGVKKPKGQKSSYDTQGKPIRTNLAKQLEKRKQPPYND